MLQVTKQNKRIVTGYYTFELIYIYFLLACRNRYTNCDKFKAYCKYHSSFEIFCPITCDKCKIETKDVPSYITGGYGLDRFTITEEQRKVISDSCLAAHNAKRALHINTPPLQYNDALAERAQWYAEYLELQNEWEHDPCMSFGHGSTHIGENLYKMTLDLKRHGWEAADMAKQIEVAIQLWYDGIENYDFTTGQMKDEYGVVIGHLTQLLWDTTAEVGCGVVTGPSGTFVVARYSPGGNISGRYTQHVYSTITSRSGVVRDDSLALILPSNSRDFEKLWCQDKRVKLKT
ncbi:venom allergen 5 2-like [Clytia hemisphaerica]|uniref:venom allergen 5 2-like n=1 Tax=Clytia hemisphaerica TaxID=252671 RepID=UPI0034D50B0E